MNCYITLHFCVHYSNDCSYFCCMSYRALPDKPSSFGTDNFFLGKKIFIVSKQKNRQKIQKIDIYNIHKLYTKQKNKKKTTHNIKHIISSL